MKIEKQTTIRIDDSLKEKAQSRARKESKITGKKKSFNALVLEGIKLRLQQPLPEKVIDPSLAGH